MRRVKKGVDLTEHNMTSAPKDRRPDVLIGMPGRPAAAERPAAMVAQRRGRARGRETVSFKHACLRLAAAGMITASSSGAKSSYLLSKNRRALRRFCLRSNRVFLLALPESSLSAPVVGTAKTFGIAVPSTIVTPTSAEGLTCSALVTQLRALALGHDELQNVQRILRTQPHLYRISGNTTALVLTSGTKFSTTQFGFGIVRF